MKRIAVPTVGGMLTSTLLTLIVIPAVYSLWREHELGAADTRTTVADAATVRLSQLCHEVLRHEHDVSELPEHAAIPCECVLAALNDVPHEALLLLLGATH